MDPLATLAPRVLTAAMVILALCALAALFRALIGPRMSDRIVAVNMIGTQAICIIACLVLRLREDWLVDIAIVYAMFSFLAVAVLTKMDIGAYRQRHAGRQKNRQSQQADGPADKEQQGRGDA